MDTERFVVGLKKERDALLASYLAASPTFVGEQLTAANLTEEQKHKVEQALDAALTDAFYTVLLALDGAASIDNTQQCYRITTEHGDDVSLGDGSLETLAFEHFQTQT